MKPTVQIVPRLLTKEQAASYIGVSAGTFVSVCPVAPIALGRSGRMLRYDVRLVDAWIDGLTQPQTLSHSDYLARMDEEHDDRARSRH